MYDRLETDKFQFALKNMLEKRNFGPITKVFLAPLLPSASGQKQKSNKRKLYTDGWVEFKSKRHVLPILLLPQLLTAI